MNQEIENSIFVTTIIRRIKFDLKEDISILACYGSAINEDDALKLPELGFYVVLKTSKGLNITKSILLSSMDCDLTAISWDQVSEISICRTNSTAMLADAKVLFSSNQEDLDTFHELQANIQKTLNHKTKNKKLCNDRIKTIKNDFYEILKMGTDFNWNIKIISFLENYLIVLATLNKTYLRKGFHNFRNEIENFRLVPYDLERKFLEVLNGKDRDEVKKSLKSLLFDLIDLVPGSIEGFTNFKPDDLDKIFNRIIPLYQKITDYCKEYDEEKVIDYAKRLDDKTSKLIEDGYITNDFPTLSEYAQMADFDGLLNQCDKHEYKISELYELFQDLKTDYGKFADLFSPFM